ncbi:MAG: 3-deoxy-7-phosphoheptulonate synthase, partial [Gammaproteobacteria bacterium]|nr:3-deoxy-7-phosphoheptulonate synthase [Gammaproteobacteria bacterium]
MRLRTLPHNTTNIRIADIKPVDSPDSVCSLYPLTESAASLVANSRRDIHNILTGADDRLIVIVGPCSIHDPKAALEYASKLMIQKQKHKQDLLIIMRVYFEKPRTRTGWKGLINDPDLNNSFDINKGVRLARKLLLELNNTGMPAGTEFLDIVTGQYYSDLISWGAIGARTTESQVHRELASGLSCPVGFKNGTDGNLDVACDAIFASAEPHIFLSPDSTGQTSIFYTEGNADTHVILRGGKTPNYDRAHVTDAIVNMEKNELSPRIMIDMSHANSQKQHKRQIEVGQDIANQIGAGETHIIGVMIESHLVEGNQSLQNSNKLKYGQSITDACLG